MRLLVLPARRRDPELAEQRGAVDLLLQIVDVELLDRAGDRPDCGNVRPHRVPVEPPEPVILRDNPVGARRRGVEVPLQVEVRPAEIVDGCH